REGLPEGAAPRRHRRGPVRAVLAAQPGTGRPLLRRAGAAAAGDHVSGALARRQRTPATANGRRGRDPTRGRADPLLLNDRPVTPHGYAWAILAAGHRCRTELSDHSWPRSCHEHTG